MSGATPGPGSDPGPSPEWAAWPEGPADRSGERPGTPTSRPTEPPAPAPRSPHVRGRRDRHDRGLRGPENRSALPDTSGLLPLAPAGIPATRSRRARFDQVAIDVLDDVETRLADRLPAIDVAVEDVPVLPDGWWGEHAPLGTLVAATGSSRARIVLFRRPIEHRARGLAELTALVLMVVVDQVADLLGEDPLSLHPDYPQG